MKRIIALLVLLLSVFLLMSCSNEDVKIHEENIVSEEANLDNVKKIILEENKGNYFQGECVGCGYVVLEKAESGENEILYLLASYGEYGFENGNFVKVSGSGANPLRITLDKDGKLLEYTVAKDGSDFLDSVKEMFSPSAFRLYLENDYAASYEICVAQEREFAESYLKSIGREAVIGEYADFDHILLTDMGVSVEVSNKMMENKGELASKCPYFIGTKEYLEDGGRFVYELSLDDEKKEISYKKYEYGKDEVLEEEIYSSETGERIK